MQLNQHLEESTDIHKIKGEQQRRLRSSKRNIGGEEKVLPQKPSEEQEISDQLVKAFETVIKMWTDNHWLGNMESIGELGTTVVKGWVGSRQRDILLYKNDQINSDYKTSPKTNGLDSLSVSWKTQKGKK